MIYILPTDTCFGIGCKISDTKSYKNIYKLKGRGFNKLLAIMVSDFDEIHKIADISKEHLDFIKSYPYPFSVLLKPKEDFLQNDLPNVSDYEYVSVRVANLDCQKRLLEEIGPIFLTSANISGEAEIYDLEEAKKLFGHYNDIEFIQDFKTIKKIPPSDIFKITPSLELEFLRKNH